MTKKIGFIVGSLREGSYNKLVAKKFASLLPEGFEASFIEIGNLPFYNEDLEVEGKVPAEWTAFREALSAVDGLLLYTRIQPLCSSSLEKCFRRWFSSLRCEQLGWQTSISRQRFSRSDRWIWCEPSLASIISLFGYAYSTTTRSLHWRYHKLDR